LFGALGDAKDHIVVPPNGVASQDPQFVESLANRVRELGPQQWFDLGIAFEQYFAAPARLTRLEQLRRGRLGSSSRSMRDTELGYSASPQASP
jgi:hypothetical protein